MIYTLAGVVLALIASTQAVLDDTCGIPQARAPVPPKFCEYRYLDSEIRQTGVAIQDEATLTWTADTNFTVAPKVGFVFTNNWEPKASAGDLSPCTADRVWWLESSAIASKPSAYDLVITAEFTVHADTTPSVVSSGGYFSYKLGSAAWVAVADYAFNPPTKDHAEFGRVFESDDGSQATSFVLSVPANDDVKIRFNYFHEDCSTATNDDYAVFEKIFVTEGGSSTAGVSFYGYSNFNGYDRTGVQVIQEDDEVLLPIQFLDDQADDLRMAFATCDPRNTGHKFYFGEPSVAFKRDAAWYDGAFVSEINMREPLEVHYDLGRFDTLESASAVDDVIDMNVFVLNGLDFDFDIKLTPSCASGSAPALVGDRTFAADHNTATVKHNEGGFSLSTTAAVSVIAGLVAVNVALVVAVVALVVVVAKRSKSESA